MNKNKEVDFFVKFCITALAEKWELDKKDVCLILKKYTNVLEDYIVPCYDALHTQSKEYIVMDITDTLNKIKAKQEKDTIKKTGRQIGINIGMEIGKKNVAKNGIKYGYTNTQIEEITELNIEEIEELREAIKRDGKN